MISFKEFIMLLDQTYLEHRFNWRYGQTLMNVLHGVWPKKYNEIVASSQDCFYDDGMVEILLTKLENEWPNE